MNQEGPTVSRGRGLAQGRSGSMLQFVLALLDGVGGIVAEWKARGWGFRLPDMRACSPFASGESLSGDSCWLGLLSYADDQFICATSYQELQSMVGDLHSAVGKLGLTFGFKKG
eukprot:5470340-Karenia_brevis.AAC.1